MGKQFDRPVDAPVMPVTERDIQILAEVHKRRFMNADQIVAAVSHMTFRDEDEKGSNANTRNRLTKLFWGGYLDRPRAQTELLSKRENVALIYAIGDRGADLLEEARGIPRGSIRWGDKNKKVGRGALAHGIGISHVTVAAEVATRRRQGVRYVDQDELLREAAPEMQSRQSPWRFEGATGLGGSAQTIACYPDWCFAFDDERDGLARVYFTLELDKNSMPVTRGKNLEANYWAARDALERATNDHNKQRLVGEVEKARQRLLRHNVTDRQRSFIQKPLAYYGGWKSKPGWHAERFNWLNYRVLTVAPTSERIETMQRAVQIVTGGSVPGMFLFATLGEIIATGDICAVGWRNAMGERVDLLA